MKPKPSSRQGGIKDGFILPREPLQPSGTKPAPFTPSYGSTYQDELDQIDVYIQERRGTLNGLTQKLRKVKERQRAAEESSHSAQ